MDLLSFPQAVSYKAVTRLHIDQSEREREQSQNLEGGRQSVLGDGVLDDVRVRVTRHHFGLHLEESLGLSFFWAQFLSQFFSKSVLVKTRFP